MGVHPSAPSVAHASGTPLHTLLEANEHWVSSSVAHVYGRTLPFLFKILSIGTALSIQAHPDRALAATLHRTQPEHYPDANHKPEMAIAITPFEALCGFRPLHEIAFFLRHCSAFKRLVGPAADAFLQATEPWLDASSSRDFSMQEPACRDALKQLLMAMTSQPDTWVRSCAEALVDDPAIKQGAARQEHPFDLILRLNQQFPFDIGLFYILLLNYIQLAPGEAIFLHANTPHAYLSGEIIECMASSDNVVRAGFTSKFKDVQTLVSMLTYTYGPASAERIPPIAFDRSIGQGVARLFQPPAHEFRVLHLSLDKGHVTYLEGLRGPSLMVCLGGHGTLTARSHTYTLRMGHVFFIGANVPVQLTAVCSGWTLYRAFTEVD